MQQRLCEILHFNLVYTYVVSLKCALHFRVYICKSASVYAQCTHVSECTLLLYMPSNYQYMEISNFVTTYMYVHADCSVSVAINNSSIVTLLLIYSSNVIKPLKMQTLEILCLSSLTDSLHDKQKMKLSTSSAIFADFCLSWSF